MTTMAIDEAHLKDAFQQCDPALVRNVCIVAHVDHGKTTLADFLVSANGIISTRLAGKLRYMDSREDEQMRGITMKSSAITLFYPPLLLNLIDSPGHVDFVSEVGSAINIADIAILIVDVVEGVCPQTEWLIRQALAHKLEILLVLNKMDRLAVELNMHQSEAHKHLLHLIEYVNSCLSQAIQGQLLEEDWQTFEKIEGQLHFDPARGNVLFASALHGYAFSLEEFAALWSKRISKVQDEEEDEIERKSKEAEIATQLKEHFFSKDYFFSTTLKKICSGAEQRGRTSLFEQFILGPLWELHRCALVDKDLSKLRQLAAKLSLPALKEKRAEEVIAIYPLMRLWLPLSSTLVRACARMKSAKKAFQSDDRIQQFLPKSESSGSNIPSSRAIACLRECDPSDPLTLVFVAKAFKLDQRKLSLCRVMGGMLSKDDNLHVLLLAQSSPSSARWKSVQIGSLYILLGRELIPVDRVPAGRICGIESADGNWLGGQLLCSQILPIDQIPRMGLHQKFVEPLVRVNVRPASAGVAEMEELRVALRQLSTLDSAVRILEQEDGELAMITAGEVHLQKCLEDLNSLGQTDLLISEPIVPFLETLVPDLRQSNAFIIEHHKTNCYLRQFSLQMTLRAVPLPSQLVQLLQQSEKIIDALGEGASNLDENDAFRSQLIKCACDCLPQMKGSWWYKRPVEQIQTMFARIWTFGPPRAKLNILFGMVDTKNGQTKQESDSSIWKGNLQQREQAIVSGFRLAMAHGPLCDEPMQGVGIVLEEWMIKEPTNEKEGQMTQMGREEPTSSMIKIQQEEDTYNEKAPRSQLDQFYGQLIPAVRQTCLTALKKHTGSLRLLAAMYRCSVQTPAQSLGKVQTVLSQKRAKVINEEINELTGLFEVTSHLPIIESFSFCDDLRKRTSGTASAQLEFSHWQLIDEDPFWKPTTEEEIEEFGSYGYENNQARVYMDAVRRRKGLHVEELIVINAEKQRNLKRNK